MKKTFLSYSKLIVAFVFGIISMPLISQSCGKIIKPQGKAYFDSIGIYRPVIIQDNYGNEYLPKDISLDEIRNKCHNLYPTAYAYPYNPTLTCNAGMFKLHFAPDNTGYGFDNVAYRNLVCKVFQDLSELLFDINPSNPSRVNIWIASDSTYIKTQNSSFPAAANAIASGLLTYPNGLNNSFIENEAMKTIKSGTNSYLNNPVLNNPENIHGFLAVNFSFNYNINDTLSAIASSQTDLYSVVLHEVYHILGLSSALKDNGGTKLNYPNVYFLYDKFLRYGNDSTKKVLNVNATTGAISFNNIVSSLSTGCKTTNSIKFFGQQLKYQEVYSPSSYQEGSSFSHLSCENGAGCANYINSLNDYTTAYCGGAGSDYIKRHPNTFEVKLLCDLGYSLKLAGGLCKYGTDTTNTTIYKTYPSCSYPINYCNAIGKDDKNFVVRIGDSITILFDSLLQNDIGANGIRGLKLLNPNDGVLKVYSNRLVFYPSSKLSNIFAVIHYQPICGVDSIRGNLTHVYINVDFFSIPLCSPSEDCNIVCRGDFELKGDSLSGLHFNPGFVKYYDKVINGSNDILLQCINGTDTVLIGGPFDYPNCGQPNPFSAKLAPNGGKYCAGIGVVTGSNFKTTEAITLKLKKTLLPNKQYILKFIARKRYAFSSHTSFKSMVVGDSFTSFYGKSTTNYVGGDAQRLDRKGLIFNTYDTVWKTFIDTITPNRPINSILIMNDTFAQANIIAASCYVFYDNFEITELIQEPISITPTVYDTAPCINDNVYRIKYRLCADSMDISDSLKVKLIIPSHLITQSGTDFNASLEYIIPKANLKKGMCKDLNYYFKLNNATTIPNELQEIRLEVKSANVCYSNNDASTVKIRPKLSPISITKTMNKSAPNLFDSITFSITVCNHGSDSLSNLQFQDTLAYSLIVYDKGNFTQTGNILSKTYNLPKAISATQPYCITEQYKATLDDICPFQNCARIFHPTNSCINRTSCIDINQDKKDSFKIIAPSKSFCQGDTLILRHSRGYYGGYSRWEHNASQIAFTTDTFLKITQAGFYEVFHERLFGCLYYDTIRITIDSLPKLTKTITPAFCDNTNGAIAITVYGAKPPYTYSWSHAATTPSITGLSSGKYKLTVTDSMGCKTKDSSMVARQNSGLNISRTIVQSPTCSNSVNGQVNIAVSGGIAPYTFLWNSGATTQNRTGLGVGVYWVRVKDSRNCYDTLYFSLLPSSMLQGKIDTVLPCDRRFFILKAKPTNGVSPHSYVWKSPINILQYTDTLQVNYLQNKWHYLTVTDALGCQYKDSFYSTRPDSLIQFTTSYNLKSQIGAGKMLSSTTISDKVIIDLRTIDTNASFERCRFIHNINPLEIQTNKSLKLYDCKLYTCNVQGMAWYGIKLNNNANLDLLRDTILDAYAGVNALGSTNISVQNTIFKNNYVGLYFRPYNLSMTTKTVKFTKPFISNQFIGEPNKLKSMFGFEYPKYLLVDGSDLPLHPYYTNPLDRYPVDLYTGQYNTNLTSSYAGIIMYNTANIALGGNVNSPWYNPNLNTFKGLKRGVIVKDVKNIILKNFKFDSVAHTAITSVSDDGYKYFMPTYFDFGAFSTVVLNTNISNSPYAIANSNASLSVRNSNINNSSYGINARTIYSTSVNAEQNSIIASLKGIHSIHAGLIPSYNFKNNVIDIMGTSYQAQGLVIQSAVFPGARVLNFVESNQVKLRGKADFGYVFNSLRNVNSVITPGTNSIVKNNAAYLIQSTPSTATNAYYKGGMVSYNSHLDITNNSISAYSRTAVNPDVLPAHYPIGLALGVTDGLVGCNILNTIRTGVAYSTDCKQSKFRRNKFNSHTIGLKIDNFSLLDTQINAGNTWIGSYSGGNSVLNLQNPLISYFVINPTSPIRYRPSGANPPAIFQFNSSTDNDACSNYNFYVGDIINGSSSNVAIMENAVSYPAFSNYLVHQDRQQLYNELKPLEPEFADTSLEKAFIEAMEASNEIDFATLEAEEAKTLSTTNAQDQQLAQWRQSIDTAYQLWVALDSMLQETTDSATAAQLQTAIDQNLADINTAQQAYSQWLANYKAENAADIQALIAQNDSLEPTILTDSFRRVFNAIYYPTFAQEKGYLITDTQIQTIRYLAHQCPLINTDVVYRSRAIMALYEDTLVYDDYAICLERGYEFKNTKQPNPYKPPQKKSLTCTISPNPTKDIVKLWFNDIPKYPIDIQITDIQGRVIFSVHKDLLSNVYTIDISQWNEGVYLVNVGMNKGHILNTKLSIIK